MGSIKKSISYDSLGARIAFDAVSKAALWDALVDAGAVLVGEEASHEAAVTAAIRTYLDPALIARGDKEVGRVSDHMLRAVQKRNTMPRHRVDLMAERILWDDAESK